MIASNRLFRILASIAAVTILLAGCVSNSLNYKWDKPQKAKLIGRRGCKVSMPLSDMDVFRGAKLSGVSDAESSKYWLEFKAQQREGDEIRYVECESVGKDHVLVGIDGFALIRGNVIVTTVFEIIID